MWAARLLASGLALAACTEEERDCDPASQNCIQCARNDDCPLGRDCCGGRCVNVRTDPTHCGACGAGCDGRSCANGACCAVGGQGCATSAECCAGFACNYGKCFAPLSLTCALDSDCPAAYTCVSRGCCLPVGTGCAVDAQCCGGLSCLGGACYADIGSPCDELHPCALNARCVGGACCGHSGADCDPTRPCCEGLSCILGSCTVPTGGACGHSLSCRQSDACIEGRCCVQASSTSDGCTSAGDCCPTFGGGEAVCTGSGSAPGSCCLPLRSACLVSNADECCNSTCRDGKCCAPVDHDATAKCTTAADCCPAPGGAAPACTVRGTCCVPTESACRTTAASGYSSSVECCTGSCGANGKCCSPPVVYLTGACQDAAGCCPGFGGGTPICTIDGRCCVPAQGNCEAHATVGFSGNATECCSGLCGANGKCCQQASRSLTNVCQAAGECCPTFGGGTADCTTDRRCCVGPGGACAASLPNECCSGVCTGGGTCQ